MASDPNPPVIPDPESVATGPGDAGESRPAAPAQKVRKSPAPSGATVPPTRAGRVWVGLCLTAVVFVALIVFLLQNTRTTRVSFLWMEGSAPLAVALLIAAVAATLLTLLVGTVRIGQLRRRARRRP
jgi:putative membrane protein